MQIKEKEAKRIKQADIETIETSSHQLETNKKSLFSLLIARIFLFSVLDGLPHRIPNYR